MILREYFVTGLVCLMAVTCHAATITDPIPYLALTDTPDVFFDDGIVHLQDFEDAAGPWEVGFKIDNGRRLKSKFIPGGGVLVTDSVDADDNSIDGRGSMGSSWFTFRSSLSITFDKPTTAASFVFTDADTSATTLTITAFDSDNYVLLSEEFDTDFLDNMFSGSTAEDRFFGISAAAGETLKSIHVAIDRGMGMEIDHIQFLEPIPEPASSTLVFVGVVGLCGIRRRRSKK